MGKKYQIQDLLHISEVIEDAVYVVGESINKSYAGKSSSRSQSSSKSGSGSASNSGSQSAASSKSNLEERV